MEPTEKNMLEAAGEVTVDVKETEASMQKPIEEKIIEEKPIEEITIEEVPLEEAPAEEDNTKGKKRKEKKSKEKKTKEKKSKNKKSEDKKDSEDNTDEENEKKDKKSKKDKDSKSKANKKKKKKLPYKRTINLAEHLEKKTNWLVAIPASILIIMAACLFSKLAVVDRMNQVSEAQAKVAALQSDVDLLYAKYDELDSVTEEYAHYTYSGLKEEEKQYFNRLDMVALIENRIMNKATVDNYQVKEDELIVPLRADSLETVKEIVADLEQDVLVNYCVMNSANTMEATENEAEYVAAQITIYLNDLEGD